MKGIVHRDLKPANIFITRAPNDVELVKLVDFGIAKLQWKGEDSTKLTQSGDLVGTPDYMSPEQCRGSEQDTRSDLYSLGCVMYHALNGRPPFSANNPVKIVLKHIKEQPQAFHQSPSATDQSVQALEACILRCLEKEPSDRFKSADELLAQLHSLEYKHKMSDLRHDAQPGPWRRLFAQLVDAAVITFITQGVDYLLFGSHNVMVPEGISQTAAWQLALLKGYCLSAGPVLHFLVDLFLLAALMFPAIFVFMLLLAQGIPFFDSVGGCLLIPMAPFFYAIYCTVLESSPLKGTLGQKLCGLEVVNEHGGRITLAQAIRRFLTKCIWPLILLGTIATTAGEKSNKIIAKAPRLWQFLKYFPTDGISRCYVIKKSPGSKTLERENYLPLDSFNNEKKLLLMERRWLQNIPLHAIVCALVLALVYIMNPENLWLFSLFSVLPVLPFALIRYKLAALRNQKTKQKAIEMVRQND